MGEDLIVFILLSIYFPQCNIQDHRKKNTIAGTTKPHTTLFYFLPISVWKIGQQSIGVGVGDVGDLVKTLDRKNSFSLFLASNGDKMG